MNGSFLPGVSAAFVVGALTYAFIDLQGAGVAAVAALCAVWWTQQPIPIAATSLIPFVVLPVLGALSAEDVAGAFGHKLILLLMGGFLLSTLMERSGAHKRVAFGVIRAFRANRSRRAVAGFMAASALLSMWISNTATTLMLLPVATAVIGQSKTPERLAPPLLLGLAWSANIGGMATPVGTPPNPLLLAELERLKTPWSFLDFMGVGVPVVVVLLPLTWVLLCRSLEDSPVQTVALAPISAPERRTLLLFGTTVMLWVTRTAPFGGWSGALGLSQVGDHTVALGMVLLAFILPDGRGERMLDWPTAVRIPWGLLLLFAGGLALGTGFRNSGLDSAVAEAFAGLQSVSTPVAMLIISGVVAMGTEVFSNTATASLLLPILSKAAESAGTEPVLWLAPATLAASCAFMMPIATAPNAIVFGTGQVDAARMAREGLLLNVVAAACIAGTCWLML